MKNIMIRIIGRHSDTDGSSELVEFVTEGAIYDRNRSLYIIYEEGEMSGLPNVKTTVKISGDGSIIMKRNGTETDPGTRMHFNKGKRYEGLYNTPYGPFQMEILTNRIVDSIDREELTGSLLVDYDISLKGLSESRTQLYMELYESGPAGSDTQNLH